MQDGGVNESDDNNVEDPINNDELDEEEDTIQDNKSS